MILADFVLGLSTRKVGEVLLAGLGRHREAGRQNPGPETVAAFHRRPFKNAYKALMLDGVVLARKTGVDALPRPVLVALGIRHEAGRRLSTSNSPAERAPRSGALPHRTAAGSPARG